MTKTSNKWSLLVEKRRMELLQENFSYREIASVLSFEFKTKYTKDMVQNRCRTTGSIRSQVTVVEEVKNKSSNVPNGSLFPKEVYSVDEEVTFTPEKKRQLNSIWEQFNDGKPKKILSLSDLHAPFINFSAVETALKDHWDADILMLNGDVFDGNALSDFDKLNDFDIEIEFKQVFTLLDVLDKHFKTIVWVGGNHDFTRFMRFVARKFGNGMKKYVFKRLNPINYIAEKYKNLIVVPHDWVEIGKCVFTHPSGYSSALMSTALNQEKYLRANSVDILPEPNFHCVVQGHTHDMGEYYINGCKVIEQGCLCHVQDYRFDRPSSRRWVTGYAVIHLDKDGNVDFNNTRSIVIQ